MFTVHNYDTMTEEKRPQDEKLDGSGMTFETLEHGGKYPDAMPQAIKMTDPEGRSCTYVPITVHGTVVDSKGYQFSSVEGDRAKNNFPNYPKAMILNDGEENYGVSLGGPNPEEGDYIPCNSYAKAETLCDILNGTPKVPRVRRGINDGGFAEDYSEES